MAAYGTCTTHWSIWYPRTYQVDSSGNTGYGETEQLPSERFREVLFSQQRQVGFCHGKQGDMELMQLTVHNPLLKQQIF